MEVEYAEVPIAVALGRVTDETGDVPLDVARRDGFGDTETLPIVITLRNATDSPLIINNLVLTIEREIDMPLCAPIGGPVVPSYLYDFVYQPGTFGPLVKRQNFAIDPQTVDSIAVTIGPDSEPLAWPMIVYSLAAETPEGDDFHFINGIHSSGTVVSSEALIQFTLDENTDPAFGLECANRGLSLIKELEVEVQGDDDVLVHEVLDELQDYYNGLIEIFG